MRVVRSLPIRVQLTVVLVIVVLVLTGSLSIVSYRAARQSLEDEGFAGLEAMAASRQETLNTLLTHKRERLMSAIEGVVLACDVMGRIEDYCVRDSLRPFMKREHASGVMLSTRRGRRYTFGDYAVPQSSSTSRIGFERGPGGQSFLNLSYTDDESGLTLEMDSSADQFHDVVASERERAVHLIASAQPAPFYVFDPHRAVATSAALQQCFGGTSHSVLEGADAAAVYRVYRPAPALPGTCIVAEEARSSVLAPAERLRRRLVRLVAIAALLALVLAYVLGFVLTRPLKLLKESVRRLKGGDYESPVPLVGSGEVHDFSEAFASMAQSIRSSRAALVENERKLKLAYKAARLWLWSYDLRTGAIVTQGPSPNGESAPKSLHSFLHQVHPSDRHMVCDAIRAAKDSGQFEAEYRMRANGREQWIAGWGQIVHNPSGTPTSIVGVSSETTSRKLAQKLETDREKLTATSNLAASLAHEINNPLTSVIGSVYLAAARVEDQESKHFLDIAAREAQRVAAIAKQMLALYRPAAAPETVDVRRVLEAALASVVQHAARKHIEVQTDLTNVGTIMGFPDEFRHAVMNLLMNAIEHSPEHATVEVRARRSRSLQNVGERGIRVIVCNHGTALSRDEIAKMFSPFVSTKAERGSGLGLWVTRAIVLKHGGKITVRSFRTPREAVCCSIYLPARSVFG